MKSVFMRLDSTRVQLVPTPAIASGSAGNPAPDPKSSQRPAGLVLSHAAGSMDSAMWRSTIRGSSLREIRFETPRFHSMSSRA
jgi:hypothetical protein